MKNTKKAFTLVELIVVITILAVLATVAFISLTGHAQDAKNSKVQADLRTMVSAIETSMTKDGLQPKDIVTGSGFDAHTMIGSSENYGTGTTFDSTSYAIGTLNFGVLGQAGDDFKDPNDEDYLIAATLSRYQLAGEIFEDDGYVVVMKGNYVSDQETDTADSLVSAKDESNFTTLINGTGSTDGSLLY